MSDPYVQAFLNDVLVLLRKGTLHTEGVVSGQMNVGNWPAMPPVQIGNWPASLAPAVSVTSSAGTGGTTDSTVPASVRGVANDYPYYPTGLAGWTDCGYGQPAVRAGLRG